MKATKGRRKGYRAWGGRLPHPFPFILSAVSVTALAAANPDRAIQVVDLGPPLGVAFCVTLAVWAVTALIVKERTKRAVIALIISLPLLTSGYAFRELRASDLSAGLRAGLEIGAVCCLVVIAIVIARRPWASRPAVPRFLNIFSVIMLAFTLPGIGRLVSPNRTLLNEESSLGKVIDSHAPRPDIYILVPDSYTGLESLKKNYGLDHSWFRDSLAARGFVFPRRPRSNFTRTFLSVGSMLNRGYPFDIVEAAAPEYSDLSAAYERLEFNRTFQDLKSIGYLFAYVGSTYSVLSNNSLADVQYIDQGWTEFERLWYAMSILPAVARTACVLADCREPVPSAESPEATQARLTYLNGLVDLPSPKLVFAHWLLPHGPYRFNAECGPLEPRWIYGGNRIEEDSIETRYYLDQLKCTSWKILEFVDAVRSTDSDPIIIIQSDHGHGRLGPVFPALAEAKLDQIEERFDVFAAYAGPGQIADSLAASRTPVNLFRTLFRVLWNADEPPLPNLFFWSAPDRWLLLEPVRLEREVDEGSEHQIKLTEANSSGGSP